MVQYIVKERWKNGATCGFDAFFHLVGGFLHLWTFLNFVTYTR